MKIIVLHPGALGDIILSLPALALLKSRFDGAHITLAANLDYLRIVPDRLADRRMSLSTLPLGNLFGSSALTAADREFWTSFDRILSWTGSGDDRFVGNLHAIHRDVLVARWRPVRTERRHVSRLFADSLIPWITAQENLPSVELGAGDSQLRMASHWLSQRGVPPEPSLIALQPGAGSLSKRWPLDHFIQLSRMLVGESFDRILVVEGPAEKGLGNRLMEALSADRSVLARCLPLDDLAALLSRCRAYVGNDSGISHLASGLRIPCVVLFGPTSPEQWAPLGRQVAVLQDNAGCAACEIGESEGHCCLGNIPPSRVFRFLAALSVHEQAAVDFDAFPDNM